MVPFSNLEIKSLYDLQLLFIRDSASSMGVSRHALNCRNVVTKILDPLPNRATQVLCGQQGVERKARL
jgi:hypothetical protein